MSVARSGAPRLVGVDAARGIALLGMFTAHLTNVHVVLDWTQPATWWAVTSGRSSVLFAVLAGVSLALVSGRTRPFVGIPLTRIRLRIVVRGVLIALLGIVLMALETPVAVILTTYGILFVAVLPVLSWSRRRLVVVAAVLALLAMPAFFGTVYVFGSGDAVVLQTFVTYPLVTFAAYVLVGVAVGRCDLGARAVGLRMLVLGALLALATYSVGESVSPGGVLFQGAEVQHLRDLVFSSEPHSSTLVDVVGSIGVAVAVIGVCVVLGAASAAAASRPDAAVSESRGRPRPPHGAEMLAVSRRVALTPLRLLAAVGAMPLTVYSAHLVVIAMLTHSGVLSTLQPTGQALVLLAFAAAALAAGWLRAGRRGPLEAGLARVAAAVVPAGSRPAS